MITRSSHRRGISIAVALLTLVVVSVIGLAVATVGTQNLNLANAERNLERARYAAEAGVAAAAVAIADSSGCSWNTGFPRTSLPTDTDCAYSVIVNNNIGGGSVMSGLDNTPVPAGMVYIQATGYVNQRSLQKIGVLMAVGSGAIFKHAAFGLTNVSLGGTSAVEDSFSSSAGPYSAANKANSGADVGTNGTGGSAVSYSGNAVSYGNVFVGPGGSSSSVNGTAGTNYTGTVQTMPTAYVIPVPNPLLIPSYTDVSYPANSNVTLPPGTYGNITTGTHTDLVLQAGTYYFSGNVLLGSQNTITLPATGIVKMYVGATWDSGGGAFVNPSNIPSNLQIYGTASCTSITINGGNGAYMVVDAPTANVNVQGNSGIYGAVIGKTVNVQGSASIHYDRDLLNGQLSRPALIRRAWKNV